MALPQARTAFKPLTGLYEPSAIQQLADGRFLVVEDEKQFPFSLFAIGPDGEVDSHPLSLPAVSADGEPVGKLDDLEGLALDATGHVYAITSHSRDGDGDEKKGREKLIRFRVEGERMVAPKVFGGLKAELAATYPVLAAAAPIRDVKTEGGLNIEGLEFAPDQRLLIGFRSPLIDRRAVIACLDNPSAMFDAGEAPRLAPALITLDLNGDGVRGMSYVAALGGFLVISGPVARAATQFQLWFWTGQPNDPARRVTVPGLPGFEHGEGISPAIVGGQPKIIIVSDDGNRQAGRCARYLLLDIQDLQIAP